MAFLSDAGLTVGGAFVLVAICMVIAGAFSCGCKNGERRGCVKVAITFYLIGALVGFAFNYGDLKIWSIVCLALAVIYIIWLLRHKKATTQQINNRVDNQADNNGQRFRETYEMERGVRL